MSKDKKQGALAPVEKTGAAIAIVDELEGLDAAELGVDGLEEIDSSDIKIGLQVYNFKGTDNAGDPIPPNVFFDTLSEVTRKEIRLALLLLNKTREWREYDEGEGVSKIRCRSMDNVTGTLEDGRTRACEGCPDYAWQSINGKRTRRCGPVYAVVAVDRDTQQPTIVRFKKTSLPVIQQYLNRHFIGRRMVAGKRANYPLFAFETVARLKMSDDKKYALPVLDRGDVLSQDEIRSHAESAKYYREIILPTLQKLVDADKSDESARGNGAGADVSFNADDFRDDATPAPAVDTAAPNRF
jgi:hypothetical protein